MGLNQLTKIMFTAQLFPKNEIPNIHLYRIKLLLKISYLLPHSY
jgi:hypothetical protein